jgi:hypothetical protein
MPRNETNNKFLSLCHHSHAMAADKNLGIIMLVVHLVSQLKYMHQFHLLWAHEKAMIFSSITWLPSSIPKCKTNLHHYSPCICITPIVQSLQSLAAWYDGLFMLWILARTSLSTHVKSSDQYNSLYTS